MPSVRLNVCSEHLLFMGMDALRKVGELGTFYMGMTCIWQLLVKSNVQFEAY